MTRILFLLLVPSLAVAQTPPVFGGSRPSSVSASGVSTVPLTAPSYTSSAAEDEPAIVIPPGAKICLDGPTCNALVTSDGQGSVITDLLVNYLYFGDARDGGRIFYDYDESVSTFDMLAAYFTAALTVFGAFEAGSVKTTTIEHTPLSLGTCGSALVYRTRASAGSAGNYGKICFCTYNGTTYAWKNITGIFASDAASIGNTTTCPNP